MSSDLAVSVSGVGKCYQVYDSPHKRLLQMLFRGRRKYFREFWALHDVSFDVRKGETVGLIGKNGAGKSTLLQIICGTLAPSIGDVKINGRVGALLELGSGFNPEFTGRENVYLNGALLGFSREQMSERFDRIVEFSGVEDFIDQPVKTYSSGMVVRLAFAVQAQSDPDILIVDEALAVGDAKFQAKCFAHLQRLKKNGTSILFVSHATEQIATHCDRAIFLSEGRIAAEGAPRDVINIYFDHMFGAERAAIEATVEPGHELPSCGYELSVLEDLFSSRQTYNPHEYRWGDGAATILDYALTCEGAGGQPSLRLGSKATLRLSIRFLTAIARPILGFTIKTKEGVTLYNTNSELQGVREIAAAGAAGDVLGVVLNFEVRFAPGDYFFSVGIASRRPDGTVVPHDRRYDSIQMTVISDASPSFTGFFDIESSITTEFRHINSLHEVSAGEC